MCRSKRRALSLVGVAVTLVTSLSSSPAALAQTSDSAAKAEAGKAGSNKAELSPAERAQRDADKVFQWIRLHADKPGAKPAIILPGQSAPAPAPAPAPVAAKNNANRTPERNGGGGDLASAKRGATVADRKGITETVTDIAPSGGAATQTAAAAVSEPAPEPTRLAAASLSASVPPTLPETLAPPPAAASPAFAEPPAPAAAEVPLKAIKMVEPEFPRQLQSTLRSGSVQVRFTVNPDGTVGRSEAIQTSHRRLNPAALDAVNQWRFEPIAKAREATVELVFRIE